MLLAAGQFPCRSGPYSRPLLSLRTTASRIITSNISRNFYEDTQAPRHSCCCGNMLRHDSSRRKRSGQRPDRSSLRFAPMDTMKRRPMLVRLTAITARNGSWMASSLALVHGFMALTNFRGHVDNHFHPEHGYKGPMPERGERPDRDTHHIANFHGNEVRDGRGHVER